MIASIISNAIEKVMLISIGVFFGLMIGYVIGISGLNILSELPYYIIIIIAIFISIGIITLILIIKKD